MSYIRKYNNYIKESVDDFTFKVGDEVIINGIIDAREFDDVESTIIDYRESGGVNTDMDDSGKNNYHYYLGPIYRIKYEDKGGISRVWWVSPYNISYKDKNIGKVKWYYKSKLDEKVVNDEFKIGDKVLVNGDIDYRLFKNKPGEIIDIMEKGMIQIRQGEGDEDDEYYDHRGKIYLIKFPDETDEEYSEWYVADCNLTKRRSGKIRWYHKGKLDENVRVSDDLIGKRVEFIGDSSIRLKKGDVGTVVTFHGDLIVVDWDREIGGGSGNGVRPGHGWNVWPDKLSEIEKDIPAGEIKWYYKGKLEK